MDEDKRYFYLKNFLFSSHLKVSVSGGVRDYLKKNFGIDSKLATSGINTDIFHPVNIEKKSGEIRILYSGDPRSLKDSEKIFLALEQLRVKYTNIVFDTYHDLGISQKHMAEKYKRLFQDFL